MWYRAEVANNAKAQLPFVIQTKGVELVAVGFDDGVSTAAFYHRDVFPL